MLGCVEGEVVGVCEGVGKAAVVLERFSAFEPRVWRGAEMLRVGVDLLRVGCGLTGTGMREALLEDGGVGRPLLFWERVEKCALGVKAYFVARDVAVVIVVAKTAETGVGGKSALLPKEVDCVRLGTEVKLVTVDVECVEICEAEISVDFAGNPGSRKPGLLTIDAESE